MKLSNYPILSLVSAIIIIMAYGSMNAMDINLQNDSVVSPNNNLSNSITNEKSYPSTQLMVFVFDAITNDRYMDDVSFNLYLGAKQIPIDKITKDHMAYYLHFRGPKGQYALTADKDGFETGTRMFKKSTDRMGTYELEAFYLKKEKVQQLDELVVSTTKIKMVMKGDTIVYDAAAFQLSEGSMLDALVKQLPGAELKNGQITVNGKPIHSLMLNGENFFSGSPSIALQNLPAYTVKNIKVYDKESEDAYLNKGQMKARDNNSLVMDVQLKKKYNNGVFGNLDAGYGVSADWKSRYMGKGFAVGYHEKNRLAAFVNTNNVLNTDAANTDGNWGAQFGQYGQLDFTNGGLDYLVSAGKLKMNGNVSLMHEVSDTRDRTSSRNFYEQGDIYGRTYNTDNARKFHIISKHDWMWKGDNMYIQLAPQLDVFRNNYNRNSQKASFTQQPYEQYRGQALDSIFLNPLKFNPYVLNSTEKSNIGKSGWDKVKLEGATKIPVLGGYDNLWFIGGVEYNTTYDNPMDIYTSIFGKESMDFGKNWRTYQGQDNKSKNGEYKLQTTYVLNYSPYKDGKFIRAAYAPTAEVKGSYSDNENQFRTLREDMYGELTPPSMHDPGRLPLDVENSYNSINNRADYSFNQQFYYEYHPVTNQKRLIFDSRLNAGVRHDKLEYHKGDYSDLLIRTKVLINPSISLQYSTFTENGNFNVRANYSFSENLPSLSYRLKTVNASNPLNVYENNPNLKSSLQNNVGFEINNFWQSLKLWMGFNASFSTADRQIASARFYDRNTGVSTYRPENINGNWSTNESFSFQLPFGPNKIFNIGARTVYSYVNSADYSSQTEALTKSIVGNTNLTQELSLNGTIGIHQIGLQGSFGWTNAKSKTNMFKTINGFNTYATAGYRVGLQKGWEINTNMTLYSRAGYNDPTMNTTNLMWNASVQKSLMKQRLTLRLDAVDILGQNSPITRTINAQGEVETWHNTMPRYVMFHVVYKFDLRPRK